MRTQLILTIFLVFMAFATSNIGYAEEGGEKMETSVFEQVSQEAKLEEGVKLISYEQFIQIRNSGESYMLLDVLSEESYNEGHIEGAMSFPVGTINEETAERLLTKDSKIIVYCAHFMCKASTKAAEKLTQLGYNVLDYKGGLKEFQEKGNELVK